MTHKRSKNSNSLDAESPVSVNIHTLSHDGRGVTKINGKTVFVENALPNEDVQVKIVKRNRRFDEGKAIEIIKSSPHRVPPLCIHFHECGGCQLQHLSHESQIQFKQDLLLEQLKHFGGVQAENLLPPPSRSRVRLSAKSPPQRTLRH